MISSIDEQLAEQLIIGGLPQNQLPQLLWLLGLAVVAMSMMLWIYHRMHHLNREKEQFMARASHELKTPLTQIRLFAETLALNREKNEARQEHYINLIHQESVRLSQLVENILNENKNNKTIESVNFQSLAIHHFILMLTKQQQILWQQKTISFDIQIDKNTELTTDVDLFWTIQLNLALMNKLF